MLRLARWYEYARSNIGAVSGASKIYDGNSNLPSHIFTVLSCADAMMAERTETARIIINLFTLNTLKTF